MLDILIFAPILFLLIVPVTPNPIRIIMFPEARETGMEIRCRTRKKPGNFKPKSSNY